MRNLGAGRVRSGGFFDAAAYMNTDDVTYDVDHLTTYTVAPHRGLSSVDDALARLRRMANTSGIWTKRLKMRIGARDLVVVDGSEPIERFPLRLVGMPVSASPCEGYENVVVFTVAHDELLRKPAEIHLFQCLGKPGTELVSDIKAAKAGIPLQKHNDPHPVPVYSTPDRNRDDPYSQVVSPPKPNVYNRNLPVMAVPVAGRQRIPDTPAVSEANTSVSVSPSTSPRSNIPEMTPEEKKALDMKMLDKSFSDIEQFVAHLQQAAKDVTDTTKPQGQRIPAPEAKEFYEIFQKFKICFIILSRLKAEIRDPNASELVHMLFGPLEIIAEASRSTDDNKLNLAAQIVSPLLTAAAIDLLNNCLSSKEMELLRSLGPTWMTPRSSWIEDIPKFVLRFADGKVAPKPWLDDLLELPVDENSYYNVPEPARQAAPTTNDVANGSNGTSDHDSLHASRSNDSMRRQKEYLIELQARGSKAFVVTKRRDANNPKELSVEVEDVVEVLDDTKNWWNVKNCRNEIGFVPKTSLRVPSLRMNAQ